MKLAEVISFRKDLLFHGAVQLGWFERNRPLSVKAASHFIFHGPDYHGICVDDFVEPGLQLVDTASFTKEITERLIANNTDEPFTIGIAGYGTGKSHLALTLATLYSRPDSEIAQNILDNLFLADEKIGRYIADSISSLGGQPFLVVALNGMEDFDLSSEISRQILSVLKVKGIDTSVLENLRPRFKLAENFIKSFHLSLEEDFREHFGTDFKVEEIIQGLDAQDEQVFKKVNEIYAQKMGSHFPAVGQESLQDFIRVVNEKYCGSGKPFAGLLIVFDEFGRYIEFAVQKPHIAGPAALQQLFEAVQENTDRVFLLAFVQTELKAYASRVMPERREEIDRYVTRFDAVPKVRLSTNLETVIANLFEKKNHEVINEQLSSLDLDQIHSSMVEWFPELGNYALWLNTESFFKVVGEGCWPLHPLSTWVLHKLTTIGKTLQQRSALSLLAEIMDHFGGKELMLGEVIRPTDLLTPGLISEFESSERTGSQRAVTDSYQVVLQKYQHELSVTEKILLKAILLQQKIGIRVTSKDDYIRAMSMFSGFDVKDAESGLNLLEKEYGVLEWNSLLHQYEIVGDAVPRRTFLANLDSKVKDIDLETRSQIFSANCKQWLEIGDFNTDFGEANEISTKEWNYTTYFTNIDLLGNQVEFALRAWCDAVNADANKGQLIYCYVGPESDLELLQQRASNILKSKMQELNLDLAKGAPLSVLFLNDYEGKFGQHLAEYRILESGFSDEEKSRFASFILDKKESTKEELAHLFAEMHEERNLIFATETGMKQARLRQMLEQLFDVVYPERIPFPFDGFYTIRGNAAADCQDFSKELLLGNLDREWLQAGNKRKRNRGYKVLDNSWGIFDNDGSIRLLPTNPKVRTIVRILDSMLKLEDEEQPDREGVNVGEILRLWMAPPFGCNLAAAGLLLSMYIGKRQDQFELLYDNRVVKTEQWLGQAMPTNFFDLSVLDSTVVVRVSEDRVSVWEGLLEEWELEPTYLGKINYMDKARQLQTRVALPQRLSDKYELLQDRTKKAVWKQNRLNRVLNDAVEKMELGNEREDVSDLSWGAAMLKNEYDRMIANKECWTKEQFEEIQEYYSTARIKVKHLFPKWLRKQKTVTIEHLRGFVYHMKVNVGGNLETIGLEEEKRLLEDHVEEVQKNVHLLAEIEASTKEAKKLLNSNTVSTTSILIDLQEWLEKAEKLKGDLQLAREQTVVGRHEIDDIASKLEGFLRSCADQIQQHKSKASSIYDHRNIACLADISAWRTEVIEFARIFSGHEKDIQDFRQVVKQLELFEKHYGRLDNNDLTDEEFSIVFEECQQELIDSFPNDSPPLDSELTYKDIMNHIGQKRDDLASAWVKTALRKTHRIEILDAVEVLYIKRQLERMPAVLSKEQRSRIETEIGVCDRRLDELEVEGLLAKFDAFSKSNKIAFLKKLRRYLEQHFTSSELTL